MNDAVRYLTSKRAVQPVTRESGAKALLPWNWGAPKRVYVVRESGVRTQPVAMPIGSKHRERGWIGEARQDYRPPRRHCNAPGGCAALTGTSAASSPTGASMSSSTS